MGAGRLEVVGPCDAWHAAAREGRWDAQGVARRVLLLVGPEGVASDAPARARIAAAPWLGKHIRGVLPLLAVELVDGRVSWVHEHVDGLGLGHVVGAEETRLLSSRAAAEVVARIAEVFASLTPELRNHRGPEPQDLLVDRLGRVQITGFVGPFAASPWMRTPRGEGDAAVVYRLGVLLAHLLAGVPPQPASDANAHEAMIRRILIRVMARPGPAPTERFTDWMRGMLAWDPSQRPPLSSVAPGLRKAAQELGPDDLVRWCSENVEERRSSLVRGAEEPPTEPDTADENLPPSSLPTQVPRHVDQATTERKRRVAAASQEDDDTQEAVPEQNEDAPVGNTRAMPLRANLPVLVGPPPEAIRNTPKLPPELFDRSEVEPEERAPRRRWGWAASLLYASVMGLLALALVVLIAFLVFVPADRNSVPHEVGRDDLAQLPMDIPDPLATRVSQTVAGAPGVQGLVALCDRRPLVDQAPVGVECVARGLWQGKPKEFRWRVTEAQHWVCFSGGEDGCATQGR